MTLRMTLACAAAAVVVGCQAKQRPFADVPAADREEMAPAITAPAEPRLRVLAQAEPAPVVPPAQPAPVVEPAPAPAQPAPAVEPTPTPVPPAPAPAPAVTMDPAAERMILRPADATLMTRADVLISVDESGSLRRAWPVTIAYAPSGDVLAGPTYWPTTDKAAYRPDLENSFLEPLEFLGNIVLLPIRAIQRPPGTPMVYSSDGPAGEERLLIGQPWFEAPAQAPANERQ